MLGAVLLVWEKIPNKKPMINTAETVETCGMIGAALCIKMLPTIKAFIAMF